MRMTLVSSTSAGYLDRLEADLQLAFQSLAAAKRRCAADPDERWLPQPLSCSCWKLREFRVRAAELALTEALRRYTRAYAYLASLGVATRPNQVIDLGHSARVAADLWRAEPCLGVAL